jgi:hypothetical protein
VHVGPERAEECLDAPLPEDGDVVHALEAGDELGALLFRHERARRALERPGGGVVVHGDDQHVGLRGGSLEVAHVADVEDVEQAVRERDGSAGPAMRGRGLEEAGPVEDLVLRAHEARSSRIAASSSLRRTVAVPYFMTTRPAA